MSDTIPRSTKSSSNLRRIHQPSTLTSKKHLTILPKQLQQPQPLLNPSIRPKFRPLDLTTPTTTTRPQQQGSNQLDSKYNVYKHGSPNFYSYSIETHKAQNIKNEICSLDLPFIENVIKELNSTSGKGMKENCTTTNMRDCELYPNLLKTHQTHKFRDLLSDKQQLKDFLKWFQTSCLMIEQKDIPQTKKFKEKQIIISSGFGEITQQVSKLSRPRSDLLKMLWNRETQEVEQIVHHLTSRVIEMQKSHLTTLSQVHTQYQSQIDTLKRQNHQLSLQLQQETLANKAYVNTLRCNRKVIKKQEMLVKKLVENAGTTIKENLALLEENTKLIMGWSMYVRVGEDGEVVGKGRGVRGSHSGEKKKEVNSSNSNDMSGRSDCMSGNDNNSSSNNSGHSNTNHNRDSEASSLSLSKAKRQSQQSSSSHKDPQAQLSPDISIPQAKILQYRRLQIAQLHRSLPSTITQLKHSLPLSITQSAQHQTTLHPLPTSTLQEKKQSLIEYIRQRLEQNPYEKLYVGEDFFHEDDHGLGFGEVERGVRRLVESKEVEMYLRVEGRVEGRVGERLGERWGERKRGGEGRGGEGRGREDGEGEREEKRGEVRKSN